MKNQDYFQYFKSISLRTMFYRKLYLYPIINNLVKGRLLDVGCGLGNMISYRPNSVGADVNEFNVNYCKARGLNVHQMSFDALPFEDTSFDSILLDNVLEHILYPTLLLNEIKRVLKTDGHIVIGVPGLRGYISDPDHKFFYDEARLEDLANLMGFEVSLMTHVPLWKSVLISQLLRQYCIYTQWKIKVVDK